MKKQRKGKYVIRPILPGATHMLVCPKKCECKPEQKFTYKSSRRKTGFILDWYCPECGGKLKMVKVTDKMRESIPVRVLAEDKKKVKK